MIRGPVTAKVRPVLMMVVVMVVVMVSMVSVMSVVSSSEERFGTALSNVVAVPSVVRIGPVTSVVRIGPVTSIVRIGRVVVLVMVVMPQVEVQMIPMGNQVRMEAPKSKAGFSAALAEVVVAMVRNWVNTMMVVVVVMA